MDNPWNTQMEFNFNEDVKNDILQWYNKIIAAPKHLRTEYLNSNILSSNSKEYLEKIYNDGYGLKIIAKWLDLSYTRIRIIFIKYLKIETRHGTNICTEKTRKFRSERVLGNKNPFYNWPENKHVLTESCSRGIQGYYLRKNGEYVWLRSSWEYIYAKWLDKNNVIWEYEKETYVLSNGQTYRPDFRILEDKENYLVEIKGALYKERLYKVSLFRKDYPDIKIIVIKNMKNYIVSNYKKELKEWKNIRLSKKELKK